MQVERFEGEDGRERARIAAVLPHDKRNPVLKPTLTESDVPEWAVQLRDEALAE